MQSNALFAPAKNIPNDKKVDVQANEVEFVKMYSKEKNEAIDQYIDEIMMKTLREVIESWQAEILRDGDPKNERFDKLKNLIVAIGTVIDADPTAKESISKIPEQLMQQVDEYLNINTPAKRTFEKMGKDQISLEKRLEYKDKMMAQIKPLGDKVITFSNNIPALILQKAIERKAHLMEEQGKRI